MTAPKPLEGFRVLDLTLAMAGPYCTMLLAGLGAEVIKIESPAGNDIARMNPPLVLPDGTFSGQPQPGAISVSMLARMRNKKSLTLNLKSDEGRRIFFDLVRTADVVVENQSEGTLERLGIGYEASRAVNPGIVYASIEGMGSASPLPGMKATDPIIQATSGLMDVTGFPDGPPTRVGISIADLVTPLYAISGLLSALLQRTRTGAGQKVTVAMLDCIASLLPMEHFDVVPPEGPTNRSGNHLNRIAPFGIYRSADGHVAISAPSDKLAAQLFDAMGRPELAQSEKFAARATRAQNADELNRLIEAWTTTLPSHAVVAELHERRGVPSAPVRRVDEVLADPALQASGALQRLSHPVAGPIEALGPGVPIRFSGATAGFDQPAHDLGADNAEVYGTLLDMSPDTLARLKSRGVI